MVTPDGTEALVLNYDSNTMTVFDTATNRSGVVSVGAGPVAVTITADGKQAYVANSLDNTVSVVTMASKMVTNTVAIDASPIGLAISPDRSTVYVAVSNSRITRSISVATGKETGGGFAGATGKDTGDGSAGSYLGLGTLSAITVALNGLDIYTVVDGGSNKTGSVVRTSIANFWQRSEFPVGAKPAGIAITPDSTKAYVTNSLDSTVSVISVATGASSTVAVGANPLGVAVSPDGTSVYVTNQSSGTVSVISVATDLVIATVVVGVSPNAVAFTPDGTKAYVTDWTSGKVAVIVAGPLTDLTISPKSSLSSPSGSKTFTTIGAEISGISLGDETALTAFSSSDVTDFISGNKVTFGPNAGERTITAVNSGATTTATVTVTGRPVVETRLTIPAGSVPFVAASADGSKVYVVNRARSDMSVFNTASNVATINSAITGPNFLATAPNGIGWYSASSNGRLVRTIAPDSYASIMQVGSNPVSIAFTSDGKTGYVVNSGSNNVSVFDVASNTVTTTIPVGIAPKAVAISPDGKTAYVSNSGDDSVSIISTASNSVSSTVLGFFAPIGVAITLDSAKVYVANNTGNSLSVISAATGLVTGTISVGAGPIGVAVSPDGTKAFVTNNVDNSVSQITVGNDTVAATVTGITAPQNVVFSPDGTKAYVAADGQLVIIVSGTISAMTIAPSAATAFAGAPIAFTTAGTDVASNNLGNETALTTFSSSDPADAITGNVVTLSSVVGLHKITATNGKASVTAAVTVTAGPRVEATVSVGSNPNGVAVTPDGSKVFVANTATNTVSVINTTTNVSTPIVVGANPRSVAITPDGLKLYVTNSGGSTVSIVDVLSGVVSGEITVGSNPVGVAFSRDGTNAIVTNSGANTISIIDPASDAVTSTLEVQINPIAVAFFSDGSGAYVANKGSNSVSVVAMAYGSPELYPLPRFRYNITVKSSPQDVAVSPDGSNMYVTSGAEGTVSVIATKTDAVTNTIDVGSGANGVAFSADGARAYVAISGSNSLSVINVATAKVMGAIASGFAGPTKVAFNKNGSKAYVTNSTSGNVSVVVAGALSKLTVSPATTTALRGGTAAFATTGTGFTGDNLGIETPLTAFSSSNSLDIISGATIAFSSALGTRTITATIGTVTATAKVNVGGPVIEATLAVGISPLALAVTLDGAKVYVANSLANSVSVIDTATNAVTAITVGANPRSLAVTPDGLKVYVLNGGPNTVSVITVATGVVASPIPLGATQGSNAIAISPNGTKAYVTNYSGNSVSVITLPGNKVSGTTITNGILGPQGLTFSPDGSFAYVTNRGASGAGAGLAQITVASNLVTSSIPLTGSPNSVLLTQDGKKAYVGNAVGGVTVVNLVAKTVESNIVAGGDVSGMALSLDGTKVYATSAVNGTVSVIEVVSNRLLAVVPEVQGASGVAFSLDGAKAYVTNASSSSVSVVVAAPLNTMTISPASDTAFVGGTTLFTATGTGSAGENLGSENPFSTFSSSSVSDTVTKNSVTFGSVVGLRTITATFGAVSVSSSILIGAAPVAASAIPVAAFSYGVAFTPDGSKALVTNPAANTVTVIDALTNALITTIAGFNNPRGVAISPDGSTAYVTNSVALGKVRVITMAGYVPSAAQITVGNLPLAVAFSPDGLKAFVTNNGGATVSVITVATKAVSPTPVAVGAQPTGVAFAPKDSKAYVTNQGGNSVSVLDASTGAVTSTISGFSGPTGVAFAPNGKTAYVVNNTSGNVSIVTVATNTVSPVPIMTAAGAFGVAFSPDGERALVSVGITVGKVVVIDTTTLNTTTLTVGATPRNLAIPLNGLKAYVANSSANSVSVINLGPIFTKAAPPVTAVLGVPYDYSFAATSANVGTITFAVLALSGLVPPGMTLSSSGRLSGTPTMGGVYNFEVSATDAANLIRATALNTITVTGGARSAYLSNLVLPPIGAGTQVNRQSSGMATLLASDTTGISAGWNVSVSSPGFIAQSTVASNPELTAETIGVGGLGDVGYVSGQAVKRLGTDTVPTGPQWSKTGGVTGNMSAPVSLVRAGPGYGSGLYSTPLVMNASTGVATLQPGLYTAVMTVTIGVGP